MFGPVVPPPPQLYIRTYVTDKQERLNGSNTYHLRLPANVPAGQFWAVDVYDAETGAFKRFALHAVDANGLVHAMLLRIQALLLPIKTLVLSGH